MGGHDGRNSELAAHLPAEVSGRINLVGVDHIETVLTVQAGQHPLRRSVEPHFGHAALVIADRIVEAGASFMPRGVLARTATRCPMAIYSLASRSITISIPATFGRKEAVKRHMFINPEALSAVAAELNSRYNNADAAPCQGRTAEFCVQSEPSDRGSARNIRTVRAVPGRFLRHGGNERRVRGIFRSFLPASGLKKRVSGDIFSACLSM